MNKAEAVTITPAIPLTMRVAVELGFVIGCADCLAIVESTSAAAFRDRQVTRFVAVPGRKHAHAVPDPQSKLSDVTTGKPVALSAASDTNGDHPDVVSEALFPSDGMNGFDA